MTRHTYPLALILWWDNDVHGAVIVKDADEHERAKAAWQRFGHGDPGALEYMKSEGFDAPDYDEVFMEDT